MKITIYMSLLGADRLWKLKQEMPLDGEGIDPITYDVTNVMYGTQISIDFGFFKELKIKGLLQIA